MKSYQLAALLAVTIVSLSACNLRQPTPEEVLSKLAVKMSDLHSFNFDMDLKLDGNIPTTFAGNLNQATFNVVGSLSGQPNGMADFSLKSIVSGQTPKGAVKLSGDLISHDDYTYFKLEDIMLPSLTPVSLGGDSRWYKVKRQVDLKAKPRITDSQLKAAKEEISKAQIFEVKEVLPLTTINGQRAYHYKVQILSDQLNLLISNLNSILDVSIPEIRSKNIERYQGEVWISVKDQRLLRLRSNDFTTYRNQPIAFDLDALFSNHNQDISIDPPTNSESVDQSRLFGLPKLPF